MRTILRTFLFLTLMPSNFLLAQKSAASFTDGKIGISFTSFGSNDVIRFVRLEGAASYNSDNFQTLGLNYLYPVNNWLEVETGIEYSWHSIFILPNLPPDMDDSPRQGSFALLQIPATVRLNFWKYFFMNSGLFLDIDGNLNSPIDSQTGIGVMIGLAMKYDFENGLSIFVNPNTKLHALLPFQPERYPERLLESGIRIGFNYNLRYRK